MKINMNSELYNGCVFLNGTYVDSTWRKDLIALLNDNVPYFDSHFEELTEADADRAVSCKFVAKFNIFVITSDSIKTYSSGWEIQDTLALDATSNLIFCAIGEFSVNQNKYIIELESLLHYLGATVCKTLDDIANILNEAYS